MIKTIERKIFSRGYVIRKAFGITKILSSLALIVVLTACMVAPAAANDPDKPMRTGIIYGNITINTK